MGNKKKTREFDESLGTILYYLLVYRKVNNTNSEFRVIKIIYWDSEVFLFFLCNYYNSNNSVLIFAIHIL